MCRWGKDQLMIPFTKRVLPQNRASGRASSPAAPDLGLCAAVSPSRYGDLVTCVAEGCWFRRKVRRWASRPTTLSPSYSPQGHKTAFVGGAVAGDGELDVDRADAVLTVFTETVRSAAISSTDSDAASRQDPGRPVTSTGRLAKDNPGRRYGCCGGWGTAVRFNMGSRRTDDCAPPTAKRINGAWDPSQRRASGPDPASDYGLGQ
jgi:hypothetical protein